MKKTRYRYHHAVQQVKKRAGEIQARKLLESSETGSLELLKEMKRVKGARTQHWIYLRMLLVQVDKSILEKNSENSMKEFITLNLMKQWTKLR